MTEPDRITCQDPRGCHRQVEDKALDVCKKYHIEPIRCTRCLRAFLYMKKLEQEEARRAEQNLKAKMSHKPGNKSAGKPDEATLSAVSNLLGFGIKETREHFVKSGLLEFRELKRGTLIYTFVKKKSVLRLIEQIRRGDKTIESLPTDVRLHLYGNIEKIDERLQNGALG